MRLADWLTSFIKGQHSLLTKCRGVLRLTAYVPRSPVGAGLRLWLKADVVVDGISQPLFAAQIPFGRLDADVPEQELNLFEFSTGLVTQARACAAKVVWRNVRKSATGRSLFDNTPNYFRAEAVGRYSTRFVDGTENGAFRNTGIP